MCTMVVGPWLCAVAVLLLRGRWSELTRRRSRGVGPSVEKPSASARMVRPIEARRAGSFQFLKSQPLGLVYFVVLIASRHLLILIAFRRHSVRMF